MAGFLSKNRVDWRLEAHLLRRTCPRTAGLHSGRAGGHIWWDNRVPRGSTMPGGTSLPRGTFLPRGSALMPASSCQHAGLPRPRLHPSSSKDGWQCPRLHVACHVACRATCHGVPRVMPRQHPLGKGAAPPWAGGLPAAPQPCCSVAACCCSFALTP